MFLKNFWKRGGNPLFTPTNPNKIIYCPPPSKSPSCASDLITQLFDIELIEFLPSNCKGYKSRVWGKYSVTFYSKMIKFSQSRIFLFLITNCSLMKLLSSLLFSTGSFLSHEQIVFFEENKSKYCQFLIKFSRNSKGKSWNL